MPRELVHWHILDKSREEAVRLEYDSVCKVLRSHWKQALLGAVMHDAPYYYAYGRRPEVSAISDYLHGRHGNDTLLPLFQLPRSFMQSPHSFTSEFWAYLIGMLSHAATDITFHPMVYYFTGNYFDEDPRKAAIAATRHRAFEVHLDSYFREKLISFEEPRIRDLVSACTESLTEWCKTLDSSSQVWLDPNPQHSRIIWQQAVNDMAKIQSLALSLPVGAALKLLKLCWAERFAPMQALSSCGRKAAQAAFEGQLDYLHPVSGEKIATSISDLILQARERFMAFLRPIEHLISSTDLTPLEAFPIGGSLSFGQVGATHSQFRFCDTARFKGVLD
ncbi:MAG: hypothetical protein DCC75_10370 [Proteobacteria bacterium]|nr:MAG: hypothetical protein DCC75_10370 [Pseudomonadota bacterium]